MHAISEWSGPLTGVVLNTGDVRDVRGVEISLIITVKCSNISILFNVLFPVSVSILKLCAKKSLSSHNGPQGSPFL